jgi:hypothetical protein
MEWEVVNRIYLAQDGHNWWALMSMIMDLKVP